MIKRVLPILSRQNKNQSSGNSTIASSIFLGTTTTKPSNDKNVGLASPSFSTLQHFHQHSYPSSSNAFSSSSLPSLASYKKRVRFPSSSKISTGKANTHALRSSSFHTEADFHDGADESLETIQDTLESYLEDNDIESLLSESSSAADEESEPEINLASGVLNIKLPPHGTWVINKQTPNRQLWWSSPLSGPRRYEWDEDAGRWSYTRGGGEGGDDGVEYLGETLEGEMKGIFGAELSLGDV